MQRRFYLSCRVEPFSRSDARDTELAATLRKSIGERRDRRVVVLTGNIHARVESGMPWDASFVPMVAQLRALDRDLTIVSVNAVHRGGSTWACISTSPDIAPKCQTWSQRDDASALGAGVKLFAEPVGGYNGALFVGAISASLPIHGGQ